MDAELMPDLFFTLRANSLFSKRFPPSAPEPISIPKEPGWRKRRPGPSFCIRTLVCAPPIVQHRVRRHREEIHNTTYV